MINKNCFKDLVMVIMAWFPVLNIYKSPLPLGYGSFFVLLLCLLYSLFSESRKCIRLPRQYKVYWVWCAFVFFISYLPQFKVSALLPGGLQLFIFSITLGFFLAQFDIDAFRKQTRVVVIVTGGILILQDFMYATTGSRFIALLPFCELVDGGSMSDLISEQIKFERSSSLFREPAHFAQFLLPLLCYEIFSEKNKARLFTPYSLFIVFILVLLRSGNGFIGMILLYAVKGWVYLKNVRLVAKILTLFIIVPMLFYAVSSYISTDKGSAMLERSEELKNDETAASYVRVYRGYALYVELPLVNQVMGTNADNLLKIIPNTSISYLFRDDIVNALYMNGIQMVLIFNGLIGLLVCIWMFLSIGKGRSTQGKMQLILLLVLSLLGQTYLNVPMLFTMLLCLADNNRIPNELSKINKNSLLYTA